MSRSKVVMSDRAVPEPVREPGLNASLQTLAAQLRDATSEPQVRRLLVGVANALAGTAGAVRAPKRPCRFGPPRTAEELEHPWARRLWDEFGPQGRKEMGMNGASWLIGTRASASGRASRPSSDQHYVGVDYFHRLPAVVALTSPTSQASVLTAIVDAVVSAIVLRKAWPNGLRAEWADALSAAGFGQPSLPRQLDEVPVAIVASVEDWRALADGRPPDRIQLSTVALQAIHGLVDSLRRQGFTVTLAKVADFMGSVYVCSYSLPRVCRSTTAITRAAGV